jgi:hypothetical protein
MDLERLILPAKWKCPPRLAPWYAPTREAAMAAFAKSWRRE